MLARHAVLAGPRGSASRLRHLARQPLTVVAVRNRGRLRDPYDTPLRDGNRDRLFGLLTQRAAITLVFYLHETNQVLCKWFSNFVAANPVPRSGSNDEISGDELLRKLLCLGEQRIDNPYTFESFSFDPGSLVSRLLEVRAELAREWAEDLRWVKAENADLLRSNLQCSLQLRVTEGTDDDGRPL